MQGPASVNRLAYVSGVTPERRDYRHSLSKAGGEDRTDREVQYQVDAKRPVRPLPDLPDLPDRLLLACPRQRQHAQATSSRDGCHQFRRDCRADWSLDYRNTNPEKLAQWGSQQHRHSSALCSPGAERLGDIGRDWCAQLDRAADRAEAVM